MAANSVLADENERFLQDEHREDHKIQLHDKRITIQTVDMSSFGTEILGKNFLESFDEI